MSETLTSHITDDNIKSVRNLIKMKQSSDPFYATGNQVTNTITDIDHFPYTRYYRGVYNSSKPVVFEREAGWRPLHNGCYTANFPNKQDAYPNHCFASACSTVFPCYPEYQVRYADSEALAIQLNSACIVQYR